MTVLFQQLQQAGLADGFGAAVFAHETALDNSALSVKLGDWRLPLDGAGLKEAELARIQAAAHPAPFGWGEQTMLDTAVRDSWEIDAADLEISWQAGAQEALGRNLAAAMGLPADAVFQLSPHKLLLYRAGQFFKTHTDSEKAPGMLATLVLVLPCVHQGGVLRVTHGKQSRDFDSCAMHPGKLRLFAFYADCPHQVMSVESGARVALTFNLSLAGALPLDDAAIEIPSAPLQSLLQKLHQTTNPRPQVLMLSHRYSPAGLDWSLLKGRDVALARLARSAARQAGWDIWLCQMERINEYCLSPETSCKVEDELHLALPCEQNALLSQWQDAQGKRFPDWCNDQDDCRREIYSAEAQQWQEEDMAAFAGWSGNQGQIIKAWYRGAALCLTKPAHFPPALKLHQLWCERDAQRSGAELAAWDAQLQDVAQACEYSYSPIHAPRALLLQLAISAAKPGAAQALLNCCSIMHIPAQAMPELLQLRQFLGEDGLMYALGSIEKSWCELPPMTDSDALFVQLAQAGFAPDNLLWLLQKLCEDILYYAECILQDQTGFTGQCSARHYQGDWQRANDDLAQAMANCCRIAQRLQQPQHAQALFDLIRQSGQRLLLEFAQAWNHAFADAGALAPPFSDWRRYLQQNLLALQGRLMPQRYVLPARIHCLALNANEGAQCATCDRLQDFASAELEKCELQVTPLQAAHMVEQIAYYRLPIHYHLQENGRDSRLTLQKTEQVEAILGPRRQLLQCCLADLLAAEREV